MVAITATNAVERAGGSNCLESFRHHNVRWVLYCFATTEMHLVCSHHDCRYTSVQHVLQPDALQIY